MRDDPDSRPENGNENRGDTGSGRDSNNPFIRFKNHVNTNIHAGLNTLLFSHTSTPDTADTPGKDNAMPDPSPSRSPSSNTQSDDLTTGPSRPCHHPPQDQGPHHRADRDQEDHIESRLDLLRGATAPESALAWRLFLARSRYSPLRLERDRDLPRPRPRDLSPERQPSQDAECGGGWGWLEAFEDLMRVSSGLGLREVPRPPSAPSEGGRRDGEGAEWVVLPFGLGFGTGWGWGDGGGGGGGGPNSWGWGHDRFGHLPGPARGWWSGLDAGMREAAWLERMKRRGLTEVLFPVYDPALGYRSPATAEEWAARRRAEARRDREAGRLWEELVAGGFRALEDARREMDREADAWWEEARREMRAIEDASRAAQRDADEWVEDARRAIKREQDGSARDGGSASGRDTWPPSFFDGIGGIVKTLGKVLEDEVKSMQRFGKGDKDTQDDTFAAEKKPDRKQEGAPGTENDLYSAIQTAFHESERSLSSFFKTLSDGWRDRRPPTEPKPASPPTVETTEVVEDGITKRTTRKEYVDVHGTAHRRTETTWTDRDGRVVMTQVHSSSSTGHTGRWGEPVPGEREQDGVTRYDRYDGHDGHEREGDNIDREHKEDHADESSKADTKKEGGWFWK